MKHDIGRARALVAALALLASAASAVSAQTVANRAPAAERPDARFKVDALLVVAHPDDESIVGPYLAKAVFDEGRRVAVVFTTSGEGGRNAVGVERGASMAAVRQIEARRALGALGIDLVWFLDGRDTATQNVLISLSNWPHGDVLDGVVRAIRLTRPEVVLTFLPRVVAGENHGDHQAAGVVATEAFDAAGDPTVFAGQLAPPRLRFAPENLDPWQAKKLYYFTDAFDSGFLEGKGPSYDRMAISSAKNVPYAYLAMKSASFHLSQFAPGFPPPLLEAIAKDDAATAMRIDAERRGSARVRPVRMMLAKSLVGGAAGDDVFAGVTSGPTPFAGRAAYTKPSSTGLMLALDGVWAFYPEFWRAHGLDRLLSLEPADVAVRPASELRVPMILRNATGAAAEVTLARTSPLPTGWTEQALSSVYPLAPGDEYRIEAVLTSPAGEGTEPVPVTYEARVGSTVVGSVTLRVLVRSGAMPQ